MSSTNRLTLIATESDYESDTSIEQKEIYVDVKDNKDKSYQIKRKLICIALSVITIIALVIIVIDLIVLKPESNNTNTKEQQALFIIQDLMQLNISYNDFSHQQKTQYIKAFNVFDKNGDRFLDQTEFTDYFKLQINDWNIFQKIDSNSDNMLSYDECVSYLKEMTKIKEVQIDLVTKITQPIAFEYGVEIEENQLDSLFLEYAAIFMYYEEFKYDSNGYIHKTDYLSTSALNQFVAADINKDNKITISELSIILYGDISTNSSWNYKLQNVFGYNYKNVMHSLAKINVSPQMVDNIRNNLQISPYDITNIVNKMPKNISKDAHKAHICFKNNYCYYSYFGQDTIDIKHIYKPPIEYEIIDGIYPEDDLTEQELQRIKDAENICSNYNCCREDDDQINLLNTHDSLCTNYGYLQCLSAENKCIWDCALPQDYYNNRIRFKRIFKGIDRHIAHKIDHFHTTKDKEDVDAINMDYLSLEVMDSCGTMYEYKLTENSKQMEYINNQATDGHEATNTGHRRLFGASKSGEMNEETRRKLAVMGTDMRVGVTWKIDPWYKNVYMEFDSSAGRMRCSGALISPRHVLTAGHCVSDGAGNYYSNFKIWPSYNAGNTADFFTEESVVAFRGWHLYKLYTWDLGVVTLATDDTGYGYFPFGFNDNISVSDWFGVNGYPSDKGQIMQHQWMQMDYEVQDNLMLTSSGDIVGGNSGGPAWYYGSKVIYGVVSHETYTGYWSRVYLHNGLARITQEKYNAICGYLEGFNETIDHCPDL